MSTFISEEWAWHSIFMGSSIIKVHLPWLNKSEHKIEIFAVSIITISIGPCKILLFLLLCFLDNEKCSFENPDIFSSYITCCHGQLVGIKSKKGNWSCHPKHHVSISISSEILWVRMHLSVIASAFRILQDLTLSKCHYMQHNALIQLFVCTRGDLFSGELMYLKFLLNVLSF